MMFKGCAVVITNTARTRFLVQQKDAEYKAHPWGICLWGGAVELGESPLEGAIRELEEELRIRESRIVHMFTCMVDDWQLSLFEHCVSDAEFDRLARLPVYEGAGSKVLARAELAAADWVWGLDAPVARYMCEMRLDDRP